ncbi:MAG: hypothetical protein WC243_03840 [Patescibacteria group bacterium]|jgi:hypothetical protein
MAISNPKVRNQETPSHGNGLVIGSWVPDSLVGRILEIIEAVGLPEKQETSIKNLIKDVIYQKTTQMEAVYIEADLHDAIRDAGKLSQINIVGLKEIK